MSKMEYIIFLAIIDRFVQWGDLNEHFKNVTEKIKSWSDFKLWLVSLDDCGDHGDEESLSANCMA